MAIRTQQFIARAVLAALLGIGAAAAAQAAAPDYPKALQQAVASGVKVVSSFAAGSGLTGWVLAEGARYSIVYTTADKKLLLAGMLIGEHGENLNALFEEKYIPKPDLSALMQKLEKAGAVTEGAAKDAKGVVYVFVDPNCPYCHLTWKALQPYEKAGLQVRWLLVATLGPTSLPKAIEVLAAPDQVAAFRTMEANQGKPFKPGAQSAEATHAAQVATIRHNGELMEQFGVSGTPGIVWKDHQGKVHVKSGLPHLSELPAITGLPEQKIDDPDLAKFR